VEAAPYQQESRGIQGEESDPELDLLAETESDSDDNHSKPGRRVCTEVGADGSHGGVRYR
jgi:hypothetical protein